MGKRELIKRIKSFYVVRDRDGQFKSWTAVGKSLSADRKQRAKNKIKSGYGHLGDHRKKRK